MRLIVRPIVAFLLLNAGCASYSATLVQQYRDAGTNGDSGASTGGALGTGGSVNQGGVWSVGGSTGGSGTLSVGVSVGNGGNSALGGTSNVGGSTGTGGSSSIPQCVLGVMSGLALPCKPATDTRCTAPYMIKDTASQDVGMPQYNCTCTTDSTGSYWECLSGGSRACPRSVVVPDDSTECDPATNAACKLVVDTVVGTTTNNCVCTTHGTVSTWVCMTGTTPTCPITVLTQSATCDLAIDSTCTRIFTSPPYDPLAVNCTCTPGAAGSEWICH